MSAAFIEAHRKRRKFTTDELRALMAEGITQSEAARRLGVTQAAVAHRLECEGLTWPKTRREVDPDTCTLSVARSRSAARYGAAAGIPIFSTGREARWIVFPRRSAPTSRFDARWNVPPKGSGEISMSHKASSWLAEIPAASLSGSEFRVLFHLCDAHNSKRDAETACFPSQERLREATGLSNGGLNNALNSLEAAGFILRIRRTVPGSAVQRTYYILGFDIPPPQEQTPENGVGANSTFGEANSTFQGSKLHLSGEYPVSNGKKEQARPGNDGAQSGSRPKRGASPTAQRERKPSRIAENSNAPFAGGALDHEAQLKRLADWINSGAHVPTTVINNTKRDELLARGLVTRERLRQLQIY